MFAGLELGGALIKQDKDSTREFYDTLCPSRPLSRARSRRRKTAYPFLDTLAKWAKAAS